MHCSSVNALFLGPAPTHGLGRVEGNPTKQPENYESDKFFGSSYGRPIAVHIARSGSPQNEAKTHEPKKSAISQEANAS